MRVNDYLDVLRIPCPGGGGSFHPALLHDEHELVLVDAAYPGLFDRLHEAVAEAGFAVEDVTGVILTHQDIDHIGCVREVLAAAPRARVLAHALEAPYLDGRETPLKLADLERDYPNLSPEKKARCEFLREGFAARRFPVDAGLTGGELLPLCGGVEVLHTPGHTPGHICLYLREGGVLIAGDAMLVESGALTGPNPVFTQDMPLALHSLEPLRGYDIHTVVAYHGGLFKGDVSAALAQILG